MKEVRHCLTIVSVIGLALLAGVAPAFGMETGGEPDQASKDATRLGEFPPLLSALGVFRDLAGLAPAAGFLEYAVNVPFWSDGAEKRRWIRVPPGEKIVFSREGEWRFPVGTQFIKHFETRDRPGGTPRRLETRVLLCRENGGVEGACYRWRADKSEADLVPDAFTAAGAGVQGNPWYFPGTRDCKACHTTVSGGVLGVSTRQMNRPFGPAGENQLFAWRNAGLLSDAVDLDGLDALPRLARAKDQSRSISDRARSFLDANCAYCHRPGGVAGNFDARYETPLPTQNLVNGPLLINLGIDHARVIAPADVWRSVAVARLETLEGTRMPPIGHVTVDREGAALLREWIQSLPGPTVLAPPAITPATGEYRAEVEATLRHTDPQAVIHYTIDGSLPLKSSPIYTAPLHLTEPATLRARAFKEGAMQSIAVQETYIIQADPVHAASSTAASGAKQ